MKARTRIRHRGFTIIELLVVVVIIGILTTLITVNLLNAQRQARDNARKTSVNSIANAVESYYAVNKQFPGKISEYYGNNNAKDDVALCEQYYSGDSGHNYLYYYYPTQACATKSGISNYDPTQFNPSPTWIPGLGAYLNPFPTEANYRGRDGTTSNTPGLSNYAHIDLTHACNTSSTPSNDCTQTFFYRHMIGGYAIYTALEGNYSSGDKDTYQTGMSLPPNAPLLCGNTTCNPSDSTSTTTLQIIAADNVYMIIK
ncbi:type II secretion system GspH family protein [Patescibacteria group bacterium]|nr:type II secretion system GspH family protein [Patescibacteria group bacterium]